MHRHLQDALIQAQQIAKAPNAKYSFAFDGKQLLFANSQTEKLREMTAFLSPQELGLGMMPSEKQDVSGEGSRNPMDFLDQERSAYEKS